MDPQTTVIVANVSKKLDIANLWSPDTFLNEFGHIQHNTRTLARSFPTSRLRCFRMDLKISKNASRTN